MALDEPPMRPTMHAASAVSPTLVNTRTWSAIQRSADQGTLWCPQGGLHGLRVVILGISRRVPRRIPKHVPRRPPKRVPRQTNESIMRVLVATASSCTDGHWIAHTFLPKAFPSNGGGVYSRRQRRRKRFSVIFPSVGVSVSGWVPCELSPPGGGRSSAVGACQKWVPPLFILPSNPLLPPPPPCWGGVPSEGGTHHFEKSRPPPSGGGGD